MTDIKKYREFWLSNDDLKRAEERLDLGESTETSLYLYPHKDTLWRLTKVVEHTALVELQAKYDELLSRHDKLVEKRYTEYLENKSKYDSLKEKSEKLRDYVSSIIHNEQFKLEIDKIYTPGAEKALAEYDEETKK